MQAVVAVLLCLVAMAVNWAREKRRVEERREWRNAIEWSIGKPRNI